MKETQESKPWKKHFQKTSMAGPIFQVTATTNHENIPKGPIFDGLFSDKLTGKQGRQ